MELFNTCALLFCKTKNASVLVENRPRTSMLEVNMNGVRFLTLLRCIGRTLEKSVYFMVFSIMND